MGEMSGMVEKVARAIYEKAMEQRPLTPLGMFNDWPEWENVSQQDKKYAIGEARAAIAAMREPTKAMQQAYWDENNVGYSPDPANHDLVWKSGIDAALNESEAE